MLGAVVSATVTMIESVMKLSVASAAVERMTTLSPFCRPERFTGTTRVTVSATGL